MPDQPPPAPLTAPAAPAAVVRLASGAVVGLAAVAISWDAGGLGDRWRWWAAAAALVLAVVLAGALPLARQLLGRPGFLPFTVLAWLAAVYGCVPETDHVLPIAMLVGMVVLLELVSGEHMPFGWQLSMMGVVLWAGLYGATGRQSALVGALFGAWPVLLGPLVATVTHLTRASQPVRWAVTASGAAAALVVARTGALEPTIGPAWRAVAVWGSASLAVALVLGWAGGRRRPVSARPARQ